MEIINNTTKTDYELYQKAKKQVAEIKGFYSHFTVYLIVILFLAFINFRYSPEYIWFFFPMFGWGIGVSLHACKAFNWMPFLGKNWEQRKIQELMEAEKRNNSTTN